MAGEEGNTKPGETKTDADVSEQEKRSYFLPETGQTVQAVDAADAAKKKRATKQTDNEG